MKTNGLLLLFIFFAGCGKDQGATGDTQNPVVTINAPTNNQVIPAGQTVNINATITDETKLEEVHLEILNTNTNTLYTHEHYSPTANTYTLTSQVTMPAGVVYKIKIGAEDRKGNKGEAEIRISSN